MNSCNLKPPQTSSQSIGIVARSAHSLLGDDQHIRVKFVEQMGNIPCNNNVGINPYDIVMTLIHQM